MKGLFPFILFIVIVINTNAQATDWLWAKSVGGTDSDFGKSVATDLNGNIFVTGYFSGDTLIFGIDTLINTVTIGGASSIFLAKYDALGNVIWAKSAGGGPFSANANSVVTDTNGNVYITGFFGSPTITFGTTTLTNTGGTCIFLAKYDALGNVLWAKSPVGNSFDQANSVTIDLNENVYVTGKFESATLTFGSITLTNPNNNNDIFLVKYNSSGNVIWGKSAGSFGYDEGASIAADTSGNVYITGTFASVITFGTTTLTNTLSSIDIFLTKYNSSGNVVWARKASGTENDAAHSVATDENGNIYVTGEFPSPTLAFGTTTLTNTSSNGFDTDIFLVKYDASGNVLWANSMGGTQQDYARSVTTDASENVYIIGDFSSPTITFGTITLTNPYTDPSFITKFDASGSAIWAKKSTGVVNSYDYSYCITTDAIGNIYFTGNFQSPTIIFGIDTLTNNNNGSADIFLVKLGIPTGVAEIENENGFTIAPNPFISQTNIIFNEVQKNTTIKIIDILGKEIKTINLTGKQLTIEKGEMQTGIYFVQIIDVKNIVANKKIIIQ